VDLVVAATAALADESVLEAGKHRQANRVVFLDVKPVVVPEHPGLAEVHSMTAVAQLDTAVAEVQHLDEEEMAVDAVVRPAGLVEGGEDHSANMAEVLRRPSRRRHQDCEGG